MESQILEKYYQRMLYIQDQAKQIKELEQQKHELTQKLKEKIISRIVGLAYNFVDPMANESDEDTRLELMMQYDEEVDGIIKDIKRL
ncbi:MAG: hypothetical protein EZS28_031654 [Streblomastix strix]|uniref:Uncharacterized protein n=1 Tax=Streblomastix strix TaxID=222440 RepID=A0A5J4URU0_9EUKA|nr:MAG: hypothetical protein EZS28_031654 [Streblomastix strix]